jgi:hypothetical protein
MLSTSEGVTVPLAEEGSWLWGKYPFVLVVVVVFTGWPLSSVSMMGTGEAASEF